jgi:HD superfamily phosphohydrolase YqeK
VELLKWLKSTDFFTAPGSTRFHDCHAGGLADHSAKVFNELVRLLKVFPEVKVSGETAAIVALLHDVCKANCYKVEMRNKKNEHGQWIQVPVYTFQEDFAFGGHGSKSVYLIQKFMKLTDEEAVCINCHMGVENGNWAVNDAFRAYPLAFLVHIADMASTIEFKS